MYINPNVQFYPICGAKTMPVTNEIRYCPIVIVHAVEKHKCIICGRLTHQHQYT